MNKQNKTENETREKNFKEKWAGRGSCCSDGMDEMMAHCCEGFNQEGTEGMKTMMSKCYKGMRVFRWFPLMPVILGIIIFLTGFLLDAETVRMLWLIISGLLVLLGFLGFILIGSMCRA